METISNHYRSPSEQLDEQQTSRLIGMGWQIPTGDSDNSCIEDDPDGSPNIFVEEPAPVNCKKLAEICTATLINILRVTHPVQLEYESFDSDGNEIALPELMLKRQAKQAEHEETLRNLLLSALVEITGLQDLEFNEDGIIRGISYGSISTYISFSGSSPQYVRLLGVLKTNIKPTQKLLKWLNRINTDTENLQLFHSEGALLARSETFATPFMRLNIQHAVQSFCEKADEINAFFRIEFSEYAADISKSPSQFKH